MQKIAEDISEKLFLTSPNSNDASKNFTDSHSIIAKNFSHISKDNFHSHVRKISDDNIEMRFSHKRQVA